MRVLSVRVFERTCLTITLALAQIELLNSVKPIAWSPECMDLHSGAKWKRELTKNTQTLFGYNNQTIAIASAD